MVIKVKEEKLRIEEEKDKLVIFCEQGKKRKWKYIIIILILQIYK